MNLLYVIILAIVQGLAELLPVSSSAHVIVAEKLMRLNPAAPDMTLLLVMLHTGTMFAVIVYFWRRWRQAFFQNAAEFKRFAFLLVLATILTGLIGGGLIKAMEKLLFPGAEHAWIEELFGRLDLIAAALAAVGVLILLGGLLGRRSVPSEAGETADITVTQAGIIGAVQGLCLPFRGFSRSGATISAALLSGVPKVRAEDFSFALAVVLTPPAIARELLRLMQLQHIQHSTSLVSAVGPSVLGAFCAFLAGLLALKWLSNWLETGRWYLFGIYCLVAACAVAYLHHAGY